MAVIWRTNTAVSSVCIHYEVAFGTPFAIYVYMPQLLEVPASHGE